MFKNFKIRRPQPEAAPTVLAITDSPSDRALLRRMIESAGWKIAIAEDLESALEVCKSQAIEVALYDRDLQQVDWRQAVERLAQQRCRVILASFVADDYLWDEVILHGGFDILAKPFREDEVLHTLRFAWATVMKSLPYAPRIV